MMMASLISYVDRQSLSVLAPVILADTHLSAAVFGDALSAFSVAYTIANLLWGSFLDFIGLRRGMFIAVTVWTLASMSHAWVAGAAGLFLARIVLGVGEGGVFPGCMKMSSDCLPPERQSRGVAIGYSGAALGSLITPIIVVPFALQVGWRTAFYVTGALGAVWLTWWWFLAKPPTVVPRVQTSSKIVLPNPMDRRFWLIVTTYGTGAVALGVVGYLSPLFLNRALGLSQKEIGYVVWIPTLGWELGYFFWGWISDRIIKENPRPVWIFILLSALALPVVFVNSFHTWPVVIAFFFWSLFVADGFIVMGLHVGARIFPEHQRGMVGGIATASWGGVLALILPVYGRWIDAKMFTEIFVTMSLLPLAGTLIWLWLSAPWAKGRLQPMEAAETVPR